MSLGAPKSERGRSQGQGLLFRGDRQGVRRSRSAGPKAGEPKPFRAAKRKQKTAVLPGAARPVFGRQAKQCPRDCGQTRKEPKRWQSSYSRTRSRFRKPSDRRRKRITGVLSACKEGWKERRVIRNDRRRLIGGRRVRPGCSAKLDGDGARTPRHNASAKGTNISGRQAGESETAKADRAGSFTAA